MKKIIKKLLIILSVIVFDTLGILNSVHAANISSANIYMAGDCGQLLKYKGTVVKVSYVEYVNGNEHYPAYCLDKTKPRSRNNTI